MFTYIGDRATSAYTAHTPAIGQFAHVKPQASTEAVDRDSVVMAVNADDQTVPILFNLCNTTNNGTRTRPDKIPTPAVELEFPSGFITALLDSQAKNRS